MTHIVDDNVQWGGACHKRFPNRKWSFLKRTLLLITNSVFEGSTSSIYRKSYPFHSNDQKASLGIITKAFCSSASVAIWWAFFISKWFVNLLLFIVCWDDGNFLKMFLRWNHSANGLLKGVPVLYQGVLRRWNHEKEWKLTASSPHDRKPWLDAKLIRKSHMKWKGREGIKRVKENPNASSGETSRAC